MIKSILAIYCAVMFAIGCDETVNDSFIRPSQTNIEGETLCSNPGIGFFSDVRATLYPDSIIQFTNYRGEFLFEDLEVKEYSINFTLNGYEFPVVFIMLKEGLNELAPIYPSELPPQLVNRFRAVRYLDEILINWSTETETNNNGFEIEMSTGNEFNTFAFVPGFGTTIEPHEYFYYHSIADTVTKYFRLKQISFNGSFKYSFTIKI